MLALLSCFHCLDRGPNENDLALGSDRYGGLNFAAAGGVEHDELRARSGATSEKEGKRKSKRENKSCETMFTDTDRERTPGAANSLQKT